MRESTQPKTQTPPAKPFLKWAGGKRQLLPQIHAALPQTFNRYFEPMLGGGAVFFSLGRSDSILSDTNAELIRCYEVVRDQPQALIEELQTYPHAEDFYYALRAEDQKVSFKNWSDLKRAARLMYLNRTCFNGLYRVNSRGHFNVPFGDYKNPSIADSETILSCSKALQSVKLLCGSFSEVVLQAKEGDFVYFDPPYFPISKTASFTSYTKQGFDISLHKQLADICASLDKRGVQFLCSNSYCDFILGLNRAFTIEVLEAKRAINSKADKRSGVKEVLIRNY